MGFWQAVTGRSKPKQADLDALFNVPSAAITLQTGLGLTPTGDGAVCYRAAAGPAFADTQTDVVELLLRIVDRVPGVDHRDDRGGVEEVAVQVLTQQREARLTGVLLVRLRDGARGRREPERAVVGLAVVVARHAEQQQERQRRGGVRQPPHVG